MQIPKPNTKSQAIWDSLGGRVPNHFDDASDWVERIATHAGDDDNTLPAAGGHDGDYALTHFGIRAPRVVSEPPIMQHSPSNDEFATDTRQFASLGELSAEQELKWLKAFDEVSAAIDVEFLSFEIAIEKSSRLLQRLRSRN